jgi:hypothetical protein
MPSPIVFTGRGSDLLWSSKFGHIDRFFFGSFCAPAPCFSITFGDRTKLLLAHPKPHHVAAFVLRQGIAEFKPLPYIQAPIDYPDARP